MNGLYSQRPGSLLRVTVPYGFIINPVCASWAHVARSYDAANSHFTQPRTNIQSQLGQISCRYQIFWRNWRRCRLSPAIQTSGNCIRKTPHRTLRGVAEKRTLKIRDPILRNYPPVVPTLALQKFALPAPRKFKIAVTAQQKTAQPLSVCTIWPANGAKRDERKTGFEVLVGGGLGRSAHHRKSIRKFPGPNMHLFRIWTPSCGCTTSKAAATTQVIRRRIKILVEASVALTNSAALVEREWAPHPRCDVDTHRCRNCRAKSFFTLLITSNAASADAHGVFKYSLATDIEFNAWYATTTKPPLLSLFLLFYPFFQLTVFLLCSPGLKRLPPVAIVSLKPYLKPLATSTIARWMRVQTWPDPLQLWRTRATTTRNFGC